MYYPKDSYINEQAKADNQDPRKQLEEFVIGNLGHINRDAILDDTPDLKMADEEAWLIEYIRTNDPYNVLETCFFEEDLKDIVVNEYNVAVDETDVIGAMLYELGFKKKIEPTGLFHIKEKLEQLQNDTTKMTEEVDKILRNLFLFYCYLMRYEAPNEVDVVNGSKEEEDTDDTDKSIDPIDAIENLLKRYRGKHAKSLGDLYMWLKELMLLIQENNGLTSYCQRHFQCPIPLTPSQIAEIGMFRTYRNLVSSGHLIDSATWERHKERSKIDLDNMDNTSRNEWQANWNYVVRQYESNQTLPATEMERRMTMFFKKFLDLLSKNEIYPKVIVMRDYEVDAYGTIKINAVTSDPNETVVLTDCGYFEPFYEYYYHSRTNPIGIDPILVLKLELDELGMPPKKNPEEQENS